ncbi:MAG: hypothetical protein HY867_13575 [Chloroflexi bacterium]|nr:hypothetical protein [Chloroflexota bacterium]
MTEKFLLGQTVSTRNAADTLYPEDVLIAMTRHHSGDWGDLCEQDRQANERALILGGRLFSVYQDRNGTRFYIITECDHSYTTVLLPEDY